MAPRKKKQAPEKNDEPYISAASRYTALLTQRSAYQQRGEECSRLTIPSLFPKNGNINQQFIPPYQSVGARGVNNLAAKLLLALFPPGGAFFKLALDDIVLEELSQNFQGSEDDPRTELEAALGKIERSVMGRFEASGARSQLFTALKHLIVTGNGLIEILKNGKLKFHSLHRYVVCRDLESNVLEIVIKEELDRNTLPPDVAAILPQKSEEEKGVEKESCDIDLYTRIYLDAGRWVVYQEIDGKQIPGTKGSYPADKLPFLPLRFVAIDGEDYGRSYVEEYLGDIATLDSLTGSIVDFAAIAARVLMFIDPGGITSSKKVQDAPNGGIINGRLADISLLQLEKSQDFQVANQVKEETRARLEQAFLLASSVQRNAERVTAEEIRLMAGELEQTLGGIYSVLAQELQLPLVTIMMSQLQRQGKLPTLPKDTVSPQIVTGLEGLGRNTDLQRLQSVLQLVTEAVGQQSIAQWVNIGALLKRATNDMGLDAKDLIRSQQEVDQATQQAQQAALAQRAAPNMVDAASAHQQMQQQAAQAQPAPAQ